MAEKKTVKSHGTWILKDGSLVPFFPGDEVPDNLADGQLDHKTKAGVFEQNETDWATLASIGTVPMDAENRQEAAEQQVEQSTSPEAK